MIKNNKTCIVCQSKYSYCNSCSEYEHLPRWMGIFHDANCREIYNATSAFLGNEISKEQAKERLDKCNLSNKEKFHKVLLKAISEIYKEEKIEPVVDPVEEIILEIAPVFEESEILSEELEENKTVVLESGELPAIEIKSNSKRKKIVKED